MQFWQDSCGFMASLSVLNYNDLIDSEAKIYTQVFNPLLDYAPNALNVYKKHRKQFDEMYEKNVIDIATKAPTVIQHDLNDGFAFIFLVTLLRQSKDHGNVYDKKVWYGDLKSFVLPQDDGYHVVEVKLERKMRVDGILDLVRTVINMKTFSTFTFLGAVLDLFSNQYGHSISCAPLRDERDHLLCFDSYAPYKTFRVNENYEHSAKIGFTDCERITFLFRYLQ